jgi:hypothetical protein
MCETFKCLPNPGGLSDQFPFWVDCMHIIKSEISAYEAERMNDSR